MMLKDQPIRRQLMTVILLTSSIVLLLASAAFMAYEYVSFRQGLVQSLRTLAEITAANSTGALDFQDERDAREVLSALKLERNVLAAVLYDEDGKLFANYPTNESPSAFPPAPEKLGHRFAESHLFLFQAVIENGRRRGTLYLESDVSAMYDRLQLYGAIVISVMLVSFLVAVAISTSLQKRISQPILALADTAKAISTRNDYSVRAKKVGAGELGLLTDAFNHMLNQIQEREAALRASETRKSAILDSAQDGIISIDHQGRILEFNPAAHRIFDFTRDQVIGKEMAELIIPPNLRERHRRGMAHFLATGEGPVLNQRLELTGLRSDGTEFPIELSITRVGSEEPPTFTGVVRDITQRKQAERVRDQFVAIIQSSDDAIISKTLEGIITSWNPGAEKLFGFSAQEALGKSMLMLLPPDRVGEEPQILARIARGETTDHFETVRVRKDGSLIDVSVTISPIKNSQGAITGASNIARDISERRRAEEEIRQLNTTLEQRVIERTAELEAANRELEAFSYSVSHDLRAPLRGIDGFSRILAEEYKAKLDQEGKRLLGIIQSETQRMGRLIDELLNFSRLGRRPMRSSVLDMTALAKSVLEEVVARDAERKPESEVKPLPPAHGDEALMRQVFFNLLSNAVKFTRHREVARIEIGSETESEQNMYYVKDNGVGFDAKYSSKLFGVFQRLHSDQEFEGTGVGLALVQRIIHRHGGRIWAEGKLNEGATFFFTLPK